MLQKLLISFLLCIVFQQLACADESDAGFWSVQLENDLWGSNDDRFYTHGTKVSFAKASQPPTFLQKITDLLPFYEQGGGTVLHGYEIGQAIFTPEDITATQLIVDDRPYAGWLYFNMGSGHSVEDQGDRETMNFFLLTFGLVGPSSLAEGMQDSVHDLFNSTEALGWDNQLNDELGMNASYLRKWRKIHNFDEPRQIEVGYHAGFTLGNVYSYAAVGIMLRFGTHLKVDVGPPNILPGFSGVPAFNPDRRSNWYLFAGFEGRFMARNIFLDGNTFSNSHSVDKERLVGDYQFGFAYHYDDIRVSFTQMFRTREFEAQKEDSQFGAINFTVYTE